MGLKLEDTDCADQIGQFVSAMREHQLTSFGIGRLGISHHSGQGEILDHPAEAERPPEWGFDESRQVPRDGDTVVALFRREECTLKRLYRDGGKIRLVPANKRLQPMEFPAEDVEVQGVVIGLLREY